MTDYKMGPRLRAVAEKRLKAFPPFNPHSYHYIHADVKNARMPAAYHAINWGASENRVLFRRANIARALASQTSCELRQPSIDTTTLPPGSRIAVYASTLGNVFMNEIAADLVAALRGDGLDANASNELANPLDRPLHSIILAPHEFFRLGGGSKWRRDEVIETCVMFNTEQIQTTWFGASIPFLLASRGVIDLCAQTAALLRATGARALHYEPAVSTRVGWLSDRDDEHPLFEVLPEPAQIVHRSLLDWSDRSIDISFFGSDSEKRDKFFTRSAAVLARYPSFIYYRAEKRGPIRTHTANASLTRLAGHVAANSKIVLNVHRDEFPYFEWHRMVRQGMAAGALVVTDPCLPHPRFQPGVHFLEENERHIPDLLEWLINTADGRARASAVVANATEALTQYRGASAVSQFLAQVSL